jgi:hypothetical protein
MTEMAGSRPDPKSSWHTNFMQVSEAMQRYWSCPQISRIAARLSLAPVTARPTTT